MAGVTLNLSDEAGGALDATALVAPEGWLR
jgi:hypothetical protein